MLTILGAMVYLREGWLVGEAGLLGALLIIGTAYAITGTTALSLASIASNVRVRPGGAFAIISQALGLEAGGAIGVPLFIAQAASAAMYIYAFAEAWAYLFPSHPPILVACLAFTGVALLAWRSAEMAFRTQAIMLVVVACALTSAALGLGGADLHAPTLAGELPDVSMLEAFAIFFPAATGIMVGAGMSGSLANPRRAIPFGTLAAWGVTLVIYSGFAVWYSVIGTPEELIANKTLMIDRAAVPALVLVGLFSSTLMASLSSLVAAPQLLQAMAAHGVVPGHRWLARLDDGQARNAVLATTGLAGLGLVAGSLDAIAPIITSFFIMTYMAINGVVALEHMLGMISFRPTFRVPPAAPVVGLGLCLLALTVSSPFGGVGELVFVLVIYAALTRRNLQTPWETVRSGTAVALAAWAARRASRVKASERAWKPDLMVPVATRDQIREMRPLVEAMAGRSGSIRWVGLGPRDEVPEALAALTPIQQHAGYHTSWTRLRTAQYMTGIGVTLDALRGALFPPNLVVVDEQRVGDDEIRSYLENCRELGVGMALWLPHPDGGLGAQKRVDVWISDRSPDWPLRLHSANLDLPALMGYLLAEAWGARLRLRTVVRDPSQVRAGKRFLEQLIDQARLPSDTEVVVGVGSFMASLGAEPRADLLLLGIPPEVERARLQAIRDAAGGSCLWLLDSGQESALA